MHEFASRETFKSLIEIIEILYICVRWRRSL